jgi:tol-pal system protein YbgF
MPKTTRSDGPVAPGAPRIGGVLRRAAGVLILTALVVAALPGCYGKRIYEIETRLQRQYREIARLEDSLAYLQAEMTYLDTTFGGKSAPVRTNRAITESRLDEIQTRLEILESQVDENRYKISQMDMRRTPAHQLADTSGAPADTSMARASVATHLYETAYIDFTKGDFESAITGFRDFVTRFPMTDFSDDAQFMIAQSFYILEDYPKAIVEFRKVLDSYPSGDKVPEAMHRLGHSYLKIDDIETARQYFKILVNRYPGAVEAARAQEMLEALPPEED